MRSAVLLILLLCWFRAWQAALTGCKVTHEFRGRLSAAQLAWIGSTKTRLVSVSFGNLSADLSCFQLSWPLVSPSAVLHP